MELNGAYEIIKKRLEENSLDTSKIKLTVLGSRQLEKLFLMNKFLYGATDFSTDFIFVFWLRRYN